MGVGRGYGKLLLFGEHAAVYGHPALGIRLEEYLEISLETDGRDRSDGRQLPDLPPRELELIRAALDSLAVSPAGGRMEIHGTLPMSVGFGSSAAFCTALLRAVGDPSVGSPDRLWAEAHRMERVFHGTPSGIDTGLSVYPGASVIHPAPPALPRREEARLPAAGLLVGAIPRTGTTAALVAGIRALRDRDEEAVNRSLDHLGALSESVSADCPSAAVLGSLADEAHAILRTLGLSTPELETVTAALHDAGALGAKLSGAGGGGAFFGVFETKEAAAGAAHWLKKKAAQATIELVYLRPWFIGDPR